MNFTIYNLTTGEVLRTGSCPPDAVQLQANAGEGVISGEYPEHQFYWDGKSMAAIPDRPSPFHIWIAGAREWVIDTAAAWAAVRRHRDELLAATDWRMLPDAPLAPREQWVEYRRALRDVTLQQDPTAIDWPQPPLN